MQDESGALTCVCAGSTMPPTMTRLTSERSRLQRPYHSARPVRFLTRSRRAMLKMIGLLRSCKHGTGKRARQQSLAGFVLLRPAVVSRIAHGFDTDDESL